MTYLHLNSDTNNCLRNGETFMWDLPHLIFSSENKIAISSVAIDFSASIKDLSKRIKVQTNLIKRDIYNEDGIIFCLLPPKNKDVSIHFPTHEYWQLDSTQPRSILFTFQKVNNNMIKFVSLTLVIS